MKKDASIITTISLVGITILSGIVLASNKVSADDSAVDTTTITVPVSCSMSGNIATGQEHSATLQPGTYSGASGSGYENGIGKTTLTTYCNDNNGFSIYAIGFTGDDYGTTTLVGQNTNLAINTKVYESTDTLSNWSMKVTKVTDSTQSYNPTNMSITNSFDNWHVIPDTYTQVAEYKATTGSSTTDQGQGVLGAKVETTYASYVSQTQAADTYSGKVKYTMVHPYSEQPQGPQPSTAGCITYHANASDVVGTMGCHSQNYIGGYDYADIADGDTITLLASNYSRNGYGFAGWSDKFDYATNPNAKFYGPNADFVVPEGTTANGLSLYAVWVKSQGSIQDQSKVASVCNSLTTAPTDGTANLTSVSALTDQRDNNTYAIAKLADGNCWMIENLRLESTAEHNSDGTLAQGYGTSATYGNFGGLADAESANFSDSTTANSLYYSGTQSGTASIDIGTSDAGYRIPRYNNINTQPRASSPTTNNASIYSYGNYYNWHAAIADTSYSSDDHDSTSLCPTGWRLPIGYQTTNNKSFGALSVALGGPEGGDAANSNTTPTGGVMSSVFRSYPNNFVYSGYFGSSAHYRESYGQYWSSTAYNNYRSYCLFLTSSTMDPSRYYDYKYYGYSIRCTVASS